MIVDYFNQPIELSKPESEIIEDKYDFSFIVSDEYLKGLLSNICNSLKHPVTLININKTDESKKRVDSDSVYFSLRTACETLRLCASSELCKQCDKHHSDLFKGLNKSSISRELVKRIDALSPFDYQVSLYRRPTINYTKTKRVYISYDCPMLGFCELVFPIFFETNVIATMFVGQINIKNKTKHKKFASEFFMNNKELFERYLKSDPKCSEQKILNNLRNSRFRQNNKTSFKNIYNDPVGIINEVRTSSIDDTVFKELISKTENQLNALEEVLSRHMDSKRRKYFSKSIRGFEIDFFSSMDSQDYSNKNIIAVWEKLQLFFMQIQEEFSFSNILVFSDDTIKGATKTKNIVFSLDKENDIKKFDFSRITQYIDKRNYLPSNSKSCSGLFSGLTRTAKLNSDNSVIIAFAKFAVIIDLTKLKSFNYRVIDLLIPELVDSISRMHAAIQGLYSGFYKSKYQMTLRLYKHECQHVSRGLSKKSTLYFKDKESVYFNKKKALDIYNDFRSSISLLNGMASSIGLLVGKINKNDIRIVENDVSVFKEIIYKWIDMFALSIAENNIQLIVPKVSRIDDQRPFSITTNKELLEQVIYNIVDNAVKYAIWGSKIHIDFSRVYEGSSIAKLSIGNYTTYEIADGDEPYELYSRGSAISEEIEGEGIGLFVSREISNILGMKLYHKKYKISNYNIPLAYEYLRREFSLYEKDPILENKVSAEIERLKIKTDAWNFTNIVNFDKTTPISSVDIAESTIIREINKPTLWVEFIVEMEIQEN